MIPPSRDDFPNDRLCGGIGVIHGGHTKLLGRFGRETVHGYQHKQIPLGLIELVFPVQALCQIALPGGVNVEFPIAAAVVDPLVYTIKVRFAVILRGVLAAVHLQNVDGISLVPVQPVVVVVATITAVAGGAGFTGLSAAVESPHAGNRNFSRTAVLIAGRQRGQHHPAQQQNRHTQGSQNF